MQVRIYTPPPPPFISLHPCILAALVVSLTSLMLGAHATLALLL
jgi:hypothetical protein